MAALETPKETGEISKATGEECHIRLTEAQRDLVAACGGLEASAEIAGVSPSSLSNYQSIHRRQSMPVGIVTKLEQACRDAPVSRAMIRIQGFRAIPVTEEMAEVISLHMAALEVSSEQGDVAAVLVKASEDGEYSMLELDALVRESAQTVSAALAQHDRYISMRAARNIAARQTPKEMAQ